MKKIYRQGDVLIVAVTEIPEGTTRVARDNGRVVLAYGEVTGHAHALLDPDVELVETTEVDAAERRRFLRIVNSSAAVVHEEHGTIVLAPGAYEVRRQREWTNEDEPALIAD